MFHREIWYGNEQSILLPPSGATASHILICFLSVILVYHYAYANKCKEFLFIVVVSFKCFRDFLVWGSVIEFIIVPCYQDLTSESKC